MNSLIDSVIPALSSLGILGYWVLLLVTLGESLVVAGIFIPGTILMIVMGGLVAQDYYDFFDLVFFAVVGAIIGNIISYELGRLGKDSFTHKPFMQRYLSSSKVFFNAHGGKSVILARFIGPIRSIVPFVAGMSHMTRPQFYAYTVGGALIWSFSYITIGYAFGYAWREAVQWSSGAVITLIGILILTIVGWWLFRWYRQRA